MDVPLLLEARIWTTHWRRRLAALRCADIREPLLFGTMLGVPLLVVTGIIGFAYWHETHSAMQSFEEIRAEVARLEETRAQRRRDDIQCLAENVYFEARGEPLRGQYAVAEVTLNRTRAPHFPHSICAVVHEAHWDPGRQRAIADFSWTQLGDISPGDGRAWKRAKDIANAEYDDLRDPVVPGALFYHSTSIRPGWAKSRKAIATIGNHVFYR